MSSLQIARTGIQAQIIKRSHNKKKKDDLSVCLADFVYLIQESSQRYCNLNEAITARLLEQLNRICYAQQVLHLKTESNTALLSRQE